MDALPCPISLEPFVPSSVVAALSTIEIGAMYRLIRQAWVESPPGTLPRNDTLLARFAGLEPSLWSGCAPVVLSAFVPRGQRYELPALAEAHKAAVARRAAVSEQRQQAARARWGERTPDPGRKRPASEPHANGIRAGYEPHAGRIGSRIPDLRASASKPRSVAVKSGSLSEASEKPSARAVYEAARPRLRTEALKHLLHKRRYSWVGQGIKDRFHHRLVADIVGGSPDLALVWWLLERAENERPRDPVAWVTGGLQGTWPEPAEIDADGLKAFGAWWEKSDWKAQEAVEMKRAGFNT